MFNIDSYSPPRSAPLLRLYTDLRQGSGTVLEEENLGRLALVPVQQVFDAAHANIRRCAIHGGHVRRCEYGPSLTTTLNMHRSLSVAMSEVRVKRNNDKTR